VLKAAYTRGARKAFAKFGFAFPQTLGASASTGTGAFEPTPAPKPVVPKTPSLSAPKVPALFKTPKMPTIKGAADVGMAMSTAHHEGPGAVRGEPADGGQRTKSIIDRAFQQNESIGETSSMPRPAGGVYP
jgi:hypothetical protein